MERIIEVESSLTRELHAIVEYAEKGDDPDLDDHDEEGDDDPQRDEDILIDSAGKASHIADFGKMLMIQKMKVR